MTRIPLVDPESLPDAERDQLRSHRPREDVPDEYHHLINDDVRNAYRGLANNPTMLEAFRTTQNRVWNEGGLSPHQRELVILSTARTISSRYEWHNHVRVALAEGLSPDEIRAIAEDRLDSFSPDDTALVQYVSAFVDRTVTDDIHERTSEHFDPESIIAIGMLAGTYLMAGRLFGAIDLELDEPFVGWELENL
jgi:alkylhydroperoxidase family enzyme